MSVTAHSRGPLGSWRGDPSALVADPRAIAGLLGRVHLPLFVVERDGALFVTAEGEASLGAGESGESGEPGELGLRGLVPATPLEHLGDPRFAREHGARFNLVGGAMAGGITSVAMVEAFARAGMLAIFGAAGLGLGEVEDAIAGLSTRLLDRPWGSNLIHSPYEPRLEQAVVDLYLRHGVRTVSASAYLDLTLPLLRYRYAGIGRDAQGRPHAPNRVIAKVSRAEVASKFLAAPAEKWLRALVEAGALSPAQADLAAALPVATDLTAEADSGGHTDKRPALTLVPSMIALRDAAAARCEAAAKIRVGAAGGIGTPWAAAAAFAMGAAYLVTGTINQACVESGTSDTVRARLAEAGEADVTMAPAADMFEMGVELQVLRRGTMFPMRARKLWALYRAYPSLEALPAGERETLEKVVFRKPLAQVWEDTANFWRARDPEQLARAQRDPKHQMALCFRAYLGLASRWANRGVVEREADYQVWCGPAIGGFNAWTAGSEFERPAARRVVPISLSLLHGAAVLTRLSALCAQGVHVGAEALDLRPRPVAQLEELCL
ncbi:PfaD family polyunsaturated fatty acid/polyketide biosynthesis protein [Pseudenhygromyxa sp. WMMC2535]|uniref:PfaD family polyunsaturated fatty acid/polyketide biosynthesis protein n=1 Tax=Pseudenhygromyxa sp. WMMC2535 TaxID=2712867 RepID=UPI0015550BB8|nr:PfaD family polyunsaturated fatty acid/polyketide biosynthesis protein [Pseudenhygromyxa sp. WMMC2535]NVB40738.1 PfaD family polyunsaturated fatty acid/polyketide biosynthesis protein [Pseudenhygromyxa sp. WMMC2535]